MVSMKNFNPYFTEIQIDSASPVSFMKKDQHNELKIRDRFLKIEAVDEFTKKHIRASGVR